jgi:hypothetical protein
MTMPAGWKPPIETIALGTGEKKMIEGIIPSDVISYVEELWFKCYDDAEFWKHYKIPALGTCDQQKIINAFPMVYSDMNANFALAYRMIKNTMKAVNIIIDSLFEKLEEKSANKDEVLSLKKELTSKVIETLAPINEEIRKRKERDKDMSHTEVTFKT